MRKSSCLAVFVFALLLPASVLAHIQLTSPAARFVQDNNGLKTGPCGSGTRTGTVTKLVPGQTLTVTWKESVSHAGHYRIGLAASEADFAEPKDLGIPSPLPSWDLVDGIADKTGTQTYTQSVQIPAKECPACVLQLIQVMSAGTDGTNTGTFSGVYHACADVSISAGAADAGGASDGARPDLAAPDVLAVSDAPAVKDAGLSGLGGAGGGSGAGTGGAGTGGAASAGGTSAASGGKSGGSGGAAPAAGSGGVAGSSGAAATGGDSLGATGGGASGSAGGSRSAAPVGGAQAASGSPGAGGHATPDGNGGTGGTASTNAGQGGHAGAGSGDNVASGCSCHIGSARAGSSQIDSSHVQSSLGPSDRSSGVASRGGFYVLSWLVLAGLVRALRRRRTRSCDRGANRGEV